VILAESNSVARAIVETLHSTRQNVLIQKFVSESKGTDLRAFVIGDRVVAAMRRLAEGQEFRANVHRGGRAEPVQLEAAYEQAAVRAAQIIGLRIAGVDMLQTRDGPQIMEVNSSPGLEGVERATNMDVAGAIIDYVADNVAYPHMDIRQRLTVSRGYGAADLYVEKTSGICGRSIADSGLRERDIVVLTLSRAGKIIPNPKVSRVLQAGDRLLCFGKLENMREFLPPRAKRRRRRKLKPRPQSPSEST